jgi:hypothetical protein
MRASLDRIKAVVLYLDGKDLCHASPALGSAVNIVDILVDRASVLPAPAPGGCCGGDRFTAKLAPWLVAEVDAKRVTYLDWRILRALDGLAKRLWVYLEAESLALGQGGSRPRRQTVMLVTPTTHSSSDRPGPHAAGTPPLRLRAMARPSPLRRAGTHAGLLGPSGEGPGDITAPQPEVRSSTIGAALAAIGMA